MKVVSLPNFREYNASIEKRNADQDCRTTVRSGVRGFGEVWVRCPILLHREEEKGKTILNREEEDEGFACENQGEN